MELHQFLTLTVYFLAAACISVPLSKSLGLGSVLGYIIAGVIIGPMGLKLFQNTESIMHFSEIGVVLLLFVIGLELNISKLWSFRSSVFGLGSLQLLCTGALLGTLLYFTSNSLSLNVALLLGATLALSSTAFAIQILQEKKELNTPYGQSSFAILLFQDLAAIPLIALVPILSTSVDGSQSGGWKSILMAFAMIFAVIFLGRLFLRHILRVIAISRTKEVFTAASLLLVIGVSLSMELVGLSMALGAFLAGVILADSEYRHELEADIQPFKGLLLGLFFMAVGMNINLNLFIQKPLLIIFATLSLVLIKWLSLSLIGRSFSMNKRDSSKMGLVLSQSGEFGFVIFGLAQAEAMLTPEFCEILVLVVTCSMAITPFLLILQERVCRFYTKELSKEFDQEFELNDPQVIIAGFGRFGQIVSRILKLQKIPFTSLEHSPENVETSRRFGHKIYYGDASRIDLLEAAGAHKAKLFILAIDDVEASTHVAEIVTQHFPNLKILARARNRHHVFQLMKLGVTIIRRETFASSLEIAAEALNELNVNKKSAESLIEKFKRHDEELLQEQFKYTHDDDLFLSRTREMNQLLEKVFTADLEEVEETTEVINDLRN